MNSDWTFHEPHLIHWINWVWKSWHLNQHLFQFRLAQLFFLPSTAENFKVEHFCNGFDLDHFVSDLRHKLFNIFCKQLDQNEQFSPFEFSLAGIKISVWINSASLNNLGWAGPNTRILSLLYLFLQSQGKLHLPLPELPHYQVQFLALFHRTLLPDQSWSYPNIHQPAILL